MFYYSFRYNKQEKMLQFDKKHEDYYDKYDRIE